MKEAELAAYIADHYGRCAYGGRGCTCLNPGPWMGRRCPHWNPIPERTWSAVLKKHRVSLRPEGGTL